ncbi:hypothetical protein JYU34_022814 [Plutella xylostella]|uniref:Uncharacterized protein n=1 Tax=Plutella xylostella TaxID=51655 RepID=A0ABQ7PQV8_PLUXY|nr:hypothetical protein JYU34_022814 [Plutella xylostella]
MLLLTPPVTLDVLWWDIIGSGAALLLWEGLRGENLCKKSKVEAETPVRGAILLVSGQPVSLGYFRGTGAALTVRDRGHEETTSSKTTGGGS